MILTCRFWCADPLYIFSRTMTRPGRGSGVQGPRGTGFVPGCAVPRPDCGPGVVVVVVVPRPDRGSGVVVAVPGPDRGSGLVRRSKPRWRSGSSCLELHLAEIHPRRH
jgi:hypothetical protein